MVRSFYTAVSGMIVQQAKQDVLSNNLANANTVGFKSDDLFSKAYDDATIQNYAKQVNGVHQRTILGTLNLGSKIDDTTTDFTGGDIQATNSDKDFAIDGRGFFTVYRDGVGAQNYYTRDGHFHVNMNGYLVNDSGDYVMGTNLNTGADERINIGNGTVACDNLGNLAVDGKPAYKLDLVDFNDYSTLKKVGDNLYTGQNPIRNATVNVENKALEGSNVNIMTGMTDMMTAMREFESDQKVVQEIDGTVSKAVNEVGKV
ncbi:flagellar hook-basal body complex protein [Clostridium hydrogenum]|uniref:flagellar hook-basal body complex protein n=1 Tax=Clostridium hydrogenum TaxID=2855764 RepID=UPI001F24811B|nr:flagellar hook-basal body complex protein [Clostridium hydrogenum]